MNVESCAGMASSPFPVAQTRQRTEVGRWEYPFKHHLGTRFMVCPLVADLLNDIATEMGIKSVACDNAPKKWILMDLQNNQDKFTVLIVH